MSAKYRNPIKGGWSPWKTYHAIWHSFRKYIRHAYPVKTRKDGLVWEWVPLHAPMNSDYSYHRYQAKFDECPLEQELHAANYKKKGTR